jgi:phosphoribosylaminoimidazolecarboxamide formyltransferase/IMP cyclohydrolase
MTEIKTLLYGENAYQTPARFEPDPDCNDPLSLAQFELVAGTAPSYNNYCDLDRMLQTKTHLNDGKYANNLGRGFSAIAVKHGNPCGAAVSYSTSDAIQRMVEGDLLAIHGGLVILDFYVRAEHAELLLTHKQPQGKRRLLDGVVAGGFDDDSIEMLKRKGDKCRFLANKALTENLGLIDTRRRFRYVRGGRLTQPNYTYIPNFHELEWVNSKPDYSIIADFVLAWAIGCTSNSNTITLVKDGMLIGNGVGQQDRVMAVELAVRKAQRAGHDTNGAVAYSDSFFPFPDAPQMLMDAGVKAIFTSSGSITGDKPLKELAAERGVVLCMVPDKEGRGFYGH